MARRYVLGELDRAKLREFFYFSDIAYPEYMKPEYGKFFGRAFCMAAENQEISLNYTGYPGSTTGIYYALTFGASKDKWRIKKVSETISVSPEHQQYWQITLAQKEALEQKIKQALVSISQSIADLELVKTDLDRYRSFKKYLDDLNSDDKEKRETAELALKSIFVDQVDYYAGSPGGEGPGRLSMVFMRNNNILPTIVQDFMEMKGLDDLEKGKFKNLPTVEKNVLKSKWRAYQEWLSIFRSNVEQRLSQLETLVKSRMKTIEEMREWIKPTIARYRMIEDALSNAGARMAEKTAFYKLVGHAIASTSISVWLIKEYPLFDEMPTPGELLAKDADQINPLKDGWTLDHLVFNYYYGLIVDYPWITEEWVKEVGPAILKELNWEPNYYLYYSFVTVNYDKLNIRLPTGGELEDGTWEVRNWTMSTNVVWTKLLELKCIQLKEEMYVDEILGIRPKVKGRPIIFYKKTKDGYQIMMDHYNSLKKYTFVVKKDEEEIEVDVPDLDKTIFKTKKELEDKFNKDHFNLREIKEEKSIFDKIREFFLFFGFDIRLKRFEGPYGQILKEYGNKNILKPQAKRFSSIAGLIKGAMKIGTIAKPA